MFEGSYSIQTRYVQYEKEQITILLNFRLKQSNISEIGGLRNSLQIEVLQDQTHLMLQEYCSNKAPLASGKLKFGKILLTMPLISQVKFFFLYVPNSYCEIIMYFSLFRYLQEVLKLCSLGKPWATLLLKESYQICFMEAKFRNFFC